MLSELATQAPHAIFENDLCRLQSMCRMLDLFLCQEQSDFYRLLFQGESLPLTVLSTVLGPTSRYPSSDRSRFRHNEGAPNAEYVGKRSEIDLRDVISGGKALTEKMAIYSRPAQHYVSHTPQYSPQQLLQADKRDFFLSSRSEDSRGIERIPQKRQQSTDK